MAAAPAFATSYFVAPASHSPAGSDANNGTSAATPWLTTNHAVNCGDTITALPDTGYTNTQFNSYTGAGWGVSTCTLGNNVTWLQCQTFAACTLTDISAGSQPAIVLDKSYWGIQGFVITRTNAGGSTDGSCILLAGNNTGPTVVHHVIITNNVLNGCLGGGVAAAGAPSGGPGVDYLVIIGNAVYNAASGTSNCDSGITTIGQSMFDTLPGTHTYIAGNIAWKNVQGATCAGSSLTDGEGFQIDVSDGTYLNKVNPYTGLTVIENNLALGNGGPGFLYTKHKDGIQVITNNTSYGNNTDNNFNSFGGPVAEYVTTDSSSVQFFKNIGVATTTTGGQVLCSGNTVRCPNYGVHIVRGDASIVMDNNWFVNIAIAGQTTTIFGSGQFALGGRNIFEKDPLMLCGNIAACTAAIPNAPSCSGTANVVNCMAATIANFTPTASGAIGMGYQAPNTQQASIGALQDALYPAWLCNVNMPTGLISKHC